MPSPVAEATSVGGSSHVTGLAGGAPWLRTGLTLLSGRAPSFPEAHAGYGLAFWGWVSSRAELTPEGAVSWEVGVLEAGPDGLSVSSEGITRALDPH